jgi:hypothetical protein
VLPSPFALTFTPILIPCSASDDEGWQHVAPPAELPGQYRVFYTNPTAGEDWDEDQIAV